MQDVLQRVHRKEEDEEGDDMDSDDDEDAEELEKRLEGVDLEDTRSVWQTLTKEEKRQFQEMVNSGELVGLMPEYEPWWKQKIELKKIVEVGQEEDNQLKDALKNCPTVCQHIPKMSIPNPSPYVKFGLLNLLYGYAYAVKFFNGDYTAENGAHFVEIIQVVTFIELQPKLYSRCCSCWRQRLTVKILTWLTPRLRQRLARSTITIGSLSRSSIQGMKKTATSPSLFLGGSSLILYHMLL